MSAQDIFAANSPTGAPDVLTYLIKTGEVFLAGAAVVIDANGLLTEMANGGVLLKGFSLKQAFTGPGYQMANQPTIVTGRVGNAEVVLAGPGQIFAGRMVNGGTDPVTPTQTMIGESYGLAGNGSVWYVNGADTTTVAVIITDINIDAKLVYFRVLAASIQL